MKSGLLANIRCLFKGCFLFVLSQFPNFNEIKMHRYFQKNPLRTLLERD